MRDRLPLSSSVARGQRGVAVPSIIAKDEFCDSSKSVEKLMGGKLHFSPILVTAWFVNAIKEIGMKFLS